MKCRDFHHLVEGCRQAGPSPYERALIHWHLARCRRCAASLKARKPESGPEQRPVAVSST